MRRTIDSKEGEPQIWQRIQMGFTLLEVGLALTLLLGILVLGVEQFSKQLDERTCSVLADQLRLVATAAGRYLRDHYAEYQQKENPLLTLDQLKSQGYWPEIYPTQNLYGQTYQVWVEWQQGAQTCQDRLQVLVVTCGGKILPKRLMHRVARQLGAQGGFITEQFPPSKQTQGRGRGMTVVSSLGGSSTALHNGWQLPVQNSVKKLSTTAGHLALLNYLYEMDMLQANAILSRREDKQYPERNQMATDLNMGPHRVLFEKIDDGKTHKVHIDHQGVQWQQDQAYTIIRVEEDFGKPELTIIDGEARMQLSSERVAPSLQVDEESLQQLFPFPVKSYSPPELHQGWLKLPYYELSQSALQQDKLQQGESDQQLDQFAQHLCSYLPPSDGVAQEALAVAALSVGRLFLVGREKNPETVLYVCGMSFIKQHSLSQGKPSSQRGSLEQSGHSIWQGQARRIQTFPARQ